MEIIPILLIVLICAALLLGYPVAFTLAALQSYLRFLESRWIFLTLIYSKPCPCASLES